MAEFQHIPVLLEEVVAILEQTPAPAVVLDATVGGAGHALALLERGIGSRAYVGLDRDPRALAAAGERLARFGDRVTLRERTFAEVEAVLAELGIGALDALLVDCGVSSPQIDSSERGFTFQASGPLDMRMGSTGETAAELLDRLDEDELAAILREFGEVPGSRGLARRIVAARREGRIETTRDLAELVFRHAPPALRSRRVHPATLIFQALRMAVNDELGQLEALLDAVPRVLAPGGRAVFIAFHSLEDRMVKQSLRALCASDGPRGPWEGGPAVEPDFEAITRKPVVASDDEVARNPRARSAKLRAVRRGVREAA